MLMMSSRLMSTEGDGAGRVQRGAVGRERGGAAMRVCLADTRSWWRAGEGDDDLGARVKRRGCEGGGGGGGGTEMASEVG